MMLKVPAMLLGVALMAVQLLQVAGEPCSNYDSYVQWIESWTVNCKPAHLDFFEAAAYDWFESCDWVQCQCLWGALDAPVANDELARCFKQAVAIGGLTEDAQRFVTALMRTCRSHTDELSKPCGLCDKYKEHRKPACSSRLLSDVSVDADVGTFVTAPQEMEFDDSRVESV
mmetsp:Transcript_10853/g.20204  ORF Transcript_10853/g.20204 Transcript_10853/m.20204 type:complete len:172 (+) Transcript_10853:80-595(+)